MKKMDWPHAPLHRLGASGVYFLTASTYKKELFFSGAQRLDALQGGLLKYAKKYNWQLEAWAVFPNHYHFVAKSPDGEKDASSLRIFISEFHKKSASWVNQEDQAKGRKVWHNYRESHISYQNSYFTRLSYTHQNAVKHGLVKVANQYRWCSAGWFERTATPAQVKTVYGFKNDQLNIDDDF